MLQWLKWKNCCQQTLPGGRNDDQRVNVICQSTDLTMNSPWRWRSSVKASVLSTNKSWASIFPMYAHIQQWPHYFIYMYKQCKCKCKHASPSPCRFIDATVYSQLMGIATENLYLFERIRNFDNGHTFSSLSYESSRAIWLLSFEGKLRFELMLIVERWHSGQNKGPLRESRQWPRDPGGSLIDINRWVDTGIKCVSKCLLVFVSHRKDVHYCRGMMHL